MGIFLSISENGNIINEVFGNDLPAEIKNLKRALRKNRYVSGFGDQVKSI